MADSRFERFLSLTLTVVAIAMAATVVSRELRSFQSDSPQQPVLVDEWPDILRVSRAVEPGQFPIILVEFGDLECPACKVFHEATLPALRARYPDQLGVRFVHLPLANHRFARQAAVAAECAATHNAFGEFLSATFARQDSIGLISWTQIARSAGVVDMAAFNKCLAEESTRAAVDSSRALADRLRIQATPTLMVNGWRIAGTSEAEITAVIESLPRGKKPT